MIILVFLLTLFFTIYIGMPIAYSLAVCGIAMMLYLGIFDPIMVAQNMVAAADSFPLMAIPFFILAGEIMNKGGISRRIVDVAMAWTGHMRGGLGFVAIFACVFMASLSGSAIADTAAVAAILMPMMRNAGYPLPRSAGLIAAGGIIAPIIPPSIGFILIGVVGNISITKLFIAGIFPGFLMAVGLVVAWLIANRKEELPRMPRLSYAERWRATGRCFWALLLPILIIGGLKLGWYTPTESAVIAVFYALAVSFFVYREMKISDLYEVILAAAKTTAAVMFLVCGAIVAAWVIALANLPGVVLGFLEPLIDNPILLMLVMQITIIVVCTSLDFAPTILILAPVMLPVAKAAGIDPVYFGVLFVMNTAIGLITPPVGTVLNVVASVGKQSLDKVIPATVPFLIAHIVVLLLCTLFPALVMVPFEFLYR